MINRTIGRRKVVAGGLSAAAIAMIGPQRFASAQSKPSITGVTWGGPWIKAWTALTAKQNKVDVRWVLHQGATTSIIAKIKATWPRAPYDFINLSSPSIYGMMREGWLEPLTPAKIPNLAHVPAGMFIKNDQGESISAPLNSASLFWLYDEQALGMKIEKPEDLLSPKLRGKMLLNQASIGSFGQLHSLARARGGDDHNIDPGFEFLKEIVKAKNIGRMAKTDVEIVNAFTTGEVAIGFVNSGNYNELRKHKNYALLNKIPGSPIFKSYLSIESLVVLKKDGDLKPVYEFLDFALSAPVNSAYSAAIGYIPANSTAAVAPELAPLQFKDDAEREQFAIVPDIGYISKQASAWTRKFELEVLPLLN